MKWIDVKERVPKRGIHVLLFHEITSSDAKYIDIGYIICWETDAYDITSPKWVANRGDKSLGTVTHWMPLPDKPGFEKSKSSNLEDRVFSLEDKVNRLIYWQINGESPRKNQQKFEDWKNEKEEKTQ